MTDSQFNTLALAGARGELSPAIRKAADLTDQFVSLAAEHCTSRGRVIPSLFLASLSTRRGLTAAGDGLGELQDRDLPRLASFCRMLAEREGADYALYIAPMVLLKNSGAAKAGFMLLCQERGQKPELQMYVVLGKDGKAAGIQQLGKTRSAKRLASAGGFAFFPTKEEKQT